MSPRRHRKPAAGLSREEARVFRTDRGDPRPSGADRAVFPEKTRAALDAIDKRHGRIFTDDQIVSMSILAAAALGTAGYDITRSVAEQLPPAMRR